MIEFDNKLTVNQIVNDKKALVIIYYAKWCNPCKIISQTISDLEIIFENKIQIIANNIDDFNIIALENNVRTVPTLQYFKNGSLYLKESGFRTKDHLKRNMEALLTLNHIDE